MSGRAQQGMLVLADISGFTAFLAQTELEHAHDILLELTQLVVTRLQRDGGTRLRSRYRILVRPRLFSVPILKRTSGPPCALP